MSRIDSKHNPVPFKLAELQLPPAPLLEAAGLYDPGAAESRDTILARSPSLDLCDNLIHEALALFPAEARILEQFGVHPLRPSRSFKNPFNGALLPGDLDSGNPKDSWRNCGRHCVTVAHGAAVIAQDFCKHGLLEQHWVLKAFSAGLLHDADTRIRHFVYQRQHDQGAAYVAPPQDFLRTQGLSQEAVDFHASFDDPSGAQNIYKFFWLDDGRLHNQCDRLIETAVTGVALTTEHKRRLLRLIVRTVDDMTYSEIGGEERSFFLSARERLDCCSDRGWYKTLQRSALGVNQDGSVLYIEDVAKLEPAVRIASDILSMQIFMPNRLSALHKLVCDPFSRTDPCQFTKARLAAGFPWMIA